MRIINVNPTKRMLELPSRHDEAEPVIVDIYTIIGIYPILSVSNEFICTRIQCVVGNGIIVNYESCERASDIAEFLSENGTDHISKEDIERSRM